MSTRAREYFPPDLTEVQKAELTRLEGVYNKCGPCSALDGVGGFLVSGGHFGRADADTLSKIAHLFLEHNKLLNGGEHRGIDEKEITDARWFIELYNKSECGKFIDGVGNFLLGGQFGRADAMDLLRIIRHVQAVNSTFPQYTANILLPRSLRQNSELAQGWAACPLYVEEHFAHRAHQALAILENPTESLPSKRAGVTEEGCLTVSRIDHRFTAAIDNYLETLIIATREDQQSSACQNRQHWVESVMILEQERKREALCWIDQRLTRLDRDIAESQGALINSQDMKEREKLHTLRNWISPPPLARSAEEIILDSIPKSLGDLSLTIEEDEAWDKYSEEEEEEDEFLEMGIPEPQENLTPSQKTNMFKGLIQPFLPLMPEEKRVLEPLSGGLTNLPPTSDEEDSSSVEEDYEDLIIEIDTNETTEYSVKPQEAKEMTTLEAFREVKQPFNPFLPDDKGLFDSLPESLANLSLAVDEDESLYIVEEYDNYESEE